MAKLRCELHGKGSVQQGLAKAKQSSELQWQGEAESSKGKSIELKRRGYEWIGGEM